MACACLYTQTPSTFHARFHPDSINLNPVKTHAPLLPPRFVHRANFPAFERSGSLLLFLRFSFSLRLSPDKHITDHVMEALIYEESPIAECLEADAVPFETVVPPSPTPSIQAFAPRGLPKLREGLRTIRQTAAKVTDVANEEFLERFRYIIVASQLLYDDPKPRRQSQDERTIELQPLSIRGAAITAGISFTIACVLHLLRRRYKTSQPLRWSGFLTYTLLLFGGCALLIYFSRRQYLDFVRRSAGSTLGKVVKEWHNFDATATEALRFVQEVEIVSRGYEMYARRLF